MQAIRKFIPGSLPAKASPKSRPATAELSKQDFWRVVNLVVPGFVADAHSIPALRLLHLYASRNPEFEQEGYSLDKGLLLYGNVGSGKTDLLRSVQRLFGLIKSPMAFAYVNMSTVVEDFGEKGFSTMNQYERRNWMFDELGQVDKENVGNYSNKINAAENIILKRYEQFRYGCLTHFTTNLSREEMENHYDGRVWSRMQEMCNMVRVVGPDRRPVAQPKVKHRPADSIALMPELSEEDKAALVLQVVEQLKAGEQYRFLDTGGLCLSFLKCKGLIPEQVPPEMEAEEMHGLITAARYNDLDSVSRKELRRFTEAEELPQDNKYTRELAYRCEKRMLRECLEKLASGEISSSLLSEQP